MRRSSPLLPGKGMACIAPGMGGIHQSVRQLRPEPWPRSLPAAIAGRAYARAGIRRASIQVPRERNYPRMGMANAISNPSAVWRFGNSRARPETSGFAEQNNRC